MIVEQTASIYIAPPCIDADFAQIRDRHADVLANTKCKHIDSTAGAEMPVFIELKCD